jgi:hypothetical protein
LHHAEDVVCVDDLLGNPQTVELPLFQSGTLKFNISSVVSCPTTPTDGNAVGAPLQATNMILQPVEAPSCQDVPSSNSESLLQLPARSSPSTSDSGVTLEPPRLDSSYGGGGTASVSLTEPQQEYVGLGAGVGTGRPQVAPISIPTSPPSAKRLSDKHSALPSPHHSIATSLIRLPRDSSSGQGDQVDSSDDQRSLTLQIVGTPVAEHSPLHVCFIAHEFDTDRACDN